MCFVRARNMLRLKGTALARFEIRKSPSFRVDVSNLLIALCVDGPDALASGCTHGFLEVAVQAVPRTGCTIADAVCLIHGLGAVGGLVFAVEVGEGLGEAVAEAMFVVECDGGLDHIV